MVPPGAYRVDATAATLSAMTTEGPVMGTRLTARETEVLALIAGTLRTRRSPTSCSSPNAPSRATCRQCCESCSCLIAAAWSAPRRPPLARWSSPSAEGYRRQFRASVGRTAERAALAVALAEHRLVTATGPGGVGKTRLALSVAADLGEQRRDGVWFVDLLGVSDAALVTAVVADTIGVPEQRTTAVDLALVASLAKSDALLVLDNCEHVLDGVRTCVERIIADCPAVTVLATSRTRLLFPTSGCTWCRAVGRRRRWRCWTCSPVGWRPRR